MLAISLVDPALPAVAMVSQSPLRSQHSRQKSPAEAVATARAMVVPAAEPEPTLSAVVAANPTSLSSQHFRQEEPVEAVATATVALAGISAGVAVRAMAGLSRFHQKTIAWALAISLVVPTLPAVAMVNR